MLVISIMNHLKNKYNPSVHKPLIVTPIYIPPECDHPDPPHPVLLKHEFTLGLVAPKGSGKTTVMINLLNFYKNYFHNIYIFSPSIDSDEKWDWLKKQKLLQENKPLKKWIAAETLKRDRMIQNQVIQDPTVNSKDFTNKNKEKEIFTGIIPDECFHHTYSHDVFVAILKKKEKVIQALKKAGKTKYIADRDLYLFDDLVGSPMFSLEKNNPFKIFATRHRHYTASAMIVTQAYKEWNSTVRTNLSGLIIFSVANDAEVKKIYEENTMGLHLDDWLELYEHAIKEDFSFFYLNSQKPRGERVMKNFDTYLKVENKEEEEKVDNNIEQEFIKNKKIKL